MNLTESDLSFFRRAIVPAGMPPYFQERASETEWVGPAYPDVCDELYERVMVLVKKRRIREGL